MNLQERKSPLDKIKHLTFAKQDSQSSIIDIHKYPEYRDSRKEPHITSTGSILLKEPSMVSIRAKSMIKMSNQDLNSRDYLEQFGGHGLKSSTKILHDADQYSPVKLETIDVERDLEQKKLRILPPVRNSLNLKMPQAKVSLAKYNKKSSVSPARRQNPLGRSQGRMKEG